MAQHEVNQLVLAATTAGITLDRLDDFSATITWPHAASRLSRTFFRDRVVSGNSSHIKAFAAETLTSVTILGQFCDSVLKPTGALAEHTRCFDYLRVMLDILSRGLTNKMDTLRRAIRKHHEASIVLYPECVKPKIHYITHIPDCIDRQKCVLSCFAPERKHHSVKVVATHAFRRWNSTAMARQVYTLMQRVEVPQSFQPSFLKRPRPMHGTASLFSAWGGAGGCSVIYQHAQSCW